MGYWEKYCRCDAEGRVRSWDWQCSECGNRQTLRTRQCEKCGAENGEGVERCGKGDTDGYSKG